METWTFRSAPRSASAAAGARSCASVGDRCDRFALESKRSGEADHRPEVYLFGAGHVGRALAAALRPCRFPSPSSRPVQERAGQSAGRDSDAPRADAGSAGQGYARGRRVVILTHDHALDFLIASEALARTDLAYTGMIGSATKRATFASWLAREGGGDKSWTGRLTLPIGGTAVGTSARRSSPP
jgi:xanthine dehydrogenase accessory factor